MGPLPFGVRALEVRGNQPSACWFQELAFGKSSMKVEHLSQRKRAKHL